MEEQFRPKETVGGSSPSRGTGVPVAIPVAKRPHCCYSAHSRAKGDSDEQAERSADVGDEDVRLLEREEVAAGGGLVEVNDVRVSTVELAA